MQVDPNEKPKNIVSDIIAGRRTKAAIHEAVLECEAIVEIEGFSLWYGKKQALHEITLPIPRGQVTALVGPSGCGKSTLLRSINRMNDLKEGIEMRGNILLEQESILGPGVDVIELRKRMGMVFQHPNPFPMSIFENVVYPLRIDGVRDKVELKQACERSLKRAALWEEANERLQESGLSLSGGQQQRLCIARALAGQPEILLLDEPCSALDPLATSKIEDLIDDLRGDYTIILVTHDLQQAARVSNYTAFMYLGRLIEFGVTGQIFTNPTLKETEEYVTGRFG